MRILWLFLLFLISIPAAPAQAQVCREIVQQRVGIVVITNEENFASAEAERLRNLVDSVVKQLPDLPWPKRIYIGSRVAGDQFFALASNIFGATRYKETDPKAGRTFELGAGPTEMMWIHELGHVLFFGFLKQFFKTFEKMDRFSGDSPESIGHWFLKSVQEKENRIIVGDGLMKISEMQETMLSEKERAMYEITMPYQELIADLLVGLVKNDADALAKTLWLTPNHQESRFRNFSKLDEPGHGFWHMASPVHSQFGADRIRIGKHYFPQAKTPEQKSRLLRLVIEASLAELKSLWKREEVVEGLTNFYRSTNADPNDLSHRNSATEDFLGFNASLAKLNRDWFQRIQDMAPQYGFQPIRGP